MDVVLAIGHNRINEDMVHVRRGFVLVGWILVGFFTFCLLLIGMGLLVQRSDRFHTWERHPIAFGILFVVAATIVLLATVDRWAQVLPGWLGYAVFGGLIAVAQGGWHSPDHLYSMSLKATIGLTLLFAAATVLSSYVSRQSLNIFDRMVFLGFVYSFSLSALSRPPGTILPFEIWLVLLFFAASIHFLKNRKRRSARRAAGSQPDLVV